MNIISTGAADILLVDDLPTGISFLYCEIVTNQSIIPYGKQLCVPDGHYKSFPNFKYIDLPKGYNYTILGRAKELTEEQLISIMPEDSTLDFDGEKGCYTVGDITYFDPEPAFKALLESQGILLENPHEKPDEYWFYKRKDDTQSWGDFYSKQWRKAQSKVKNPLVIKAEKIT